MNARKGTSATTRARPPGSDIAPAAAIRGHVAGRLVSRFLTTHPGLPMPVHDFGFSGLYIEHERRLPFFRYAAEGSVLESAPDPRECQASGTAETSSRRAIMVLLLIGIERPYCAPAPRGNVKPGETG